MCLGRHQRSVGRRELPASRLEPAGRGLAGGGLARGGLLLLARGRPAGVIRKGREGDILVVGRRGAAVFPHGRHRVARRVVVVQHREAALPARDRLGLARAWAGAFAPKERLQHQRRLRAELRDRGRPDDPRAGCAVHADVLHLAKGGGGEGGERGDEDSGGARLRGRGRRLTCAASSPCSSKYRSSAAHSSLVICRREIGWVNWPVLTR